ncbi:reverse transcriptase-like protein [Bacillus shivajii]|uniref:reverse transcriptase-like protein n=1 Tax=Bacillus shivajii TaxID=1983719 RepID=UPI001CFA11A8|nr:reverse transcriptase-like protein [Bacillus shivajii]UCZ51497.1 reverse transcriptase-like protein [Bacillus shivajii]
MIEVYIDGGSAGDPGPSGVGVLIKGNGVNVNASVPLPPMSNHEAEFHGFIQALKLCKEHELKVLSVRTDSQLLDEAFDKKYVKNEPFKSLLNEALELVENHFDYVFMKWIPSKQNKQADQLAKKAIQKSVEKNGSS